MIILIKNATILLSGNANHGKKMDILVEHGKISKVEHAIQISADKVIEGKNLYCTIGLADIGTQSGEPGYEHRETIKSLADVAHAGGYTALITFPNTKPYIQTKAEIKYLKDKGKESGINIMPAGALSKDGQGQDIAEYIDMHQAGAVAFTDGLKSCNNSGLLLRAMQYVTHFSGTIIHHPKDEFLSHGGQMHEGIKSTELGLKGIPAEAEFTMLYRDLMLLEYSRSSMIAHAISSGKSVELIKNFRQQGNSLKSTVAYLNLCVNDSALDGFDTLYKVTPSIRTENDRVALVRGIADGTIDAIVSNHIPLDEDLKKLEFPYAAFGAGGLETAFCATIDTLKNEISLERLTECFTIGPRKILNLNIPDIKPGQSADICVFDTDDHWTFSRTSSLSPNNPFLNRKSFDCRIKATILGNEAFIF
jgi:dihydroorotase